MHLKQYFPWLFFLTARRQQHCVYFTFTVHIFIIIQLPSYAFIVSMILHYCVTNCEPSCLQRKWSLRQKDKIHTEKCEFMFLSSYSLYNKLWIVVKKSQKCRVCKGSLMDVPLSYLYVNISLTLHCFLCQ